MKLYLARHGDYILDTQGLDVLSEKGARDIICLANGIKPFNFQVFSILHSEKNRARQSAELLAEGFVCDQRPETHHGLKPEDDISAVVNDLMAWDEVILLVGHLPFMNKLVGSLITGEENKNIVNFETATLVRLGQIGQYHWMIDWILTPALFYHNAPD